MGQLDVLKIKLDEMLSQKQALISKMTTPGPDHDSVIKEYDDLSIKIADVNHDISVFELIDEAKQLGGIPLRNKQVKNYKNGSKIPIPKVYADDGLIDMHRRYTIILIPEKENYSSKKKF